MTNNPIESLLEASANIDLFAQTGRYAQVGKAKTHLPDGREIAFLKRRIVPSSSEGVGQIAHSVTEGERLDHIAYKYLNDPELFWKIADSNAAMNPLSLTQSPGASLKIEPYA